MERKIVHAANWDEVNKYIKNASDSSAVYLGCDSQQHGRFTMFAVAIVIHIDGCHGGKVFHEISKYNRIKSIRERLLKEVELAVEASLKIVESIGKKHFEVHLDVNPDPIHKSNSVSREAIGWVVGAGFKCKIKHEAWAASHAGDRYVQ